MKKVVNPKNGSDINDNIFGAPVEIKTGKSAQLIDRIAEAVVQKFPFLKIEEPSKSSKKKNEKKGKK